jgi:hypothetical protein
MNENCLAFTYKLRVHSFPGGIYQLIPQFKKNAFDQHVHESAQVSWEQILILLVTVMRKLDSTN